MSNSNDTRNWPELAIGLYDKLSERNAKIHYQFDEFEVAVPSSAGGNVEYASWKLNGKLVITTSDGNA